MLKRKSLIWITFLISAIVFGMLVFCVLGKGESYNFNISRINEILKEMLTKGISGAPYRIYTWDNAAYGSGKPLLYGDLFLYIPAFLSYLYFKVSVAYKIYIFVVLFFSYIGTVILAKKISGSLIKGIISGSVYAFIAFMLILLIQGKYLGEYSFFAFIPIVLSGCHSLMYGGKKRLAVLKISLGMSGIIFSQVIIALFFTAFIILFFVIKFKHKICFILLAMIFTLGISSYYTLPLCEQNFQLYPSELEAGNYGADRGEEIESNSKKIRTSFERSWTDINVKFKKNSGKHTYLEMPLIMYKGYVAIDNSTHQEYEVDKSENGLVRININNVKEGELTLFYRGTELQNYSVILSTISMIVLIVFVFRKKGGEL